MMIRRRSCTQLAMVALLGAPAASLAQTPAASDMVAVAVADSNADAAIRREIDRARVAGIPIEPLLTKVREGRLKRASAPRIRIAVAALAVRLDSARSIIGPSATVEELVACADALAAGASARGVRAVAAAATVRPISAPLGALAQLVASGVPPERATAMIVELLRRKVGRAQVLAFGNLVESDVADGVPAIEAAAFRLHTIGTAGAAASGDVAGNSALTNALKRPPVNSTPRRRP